MKTLKGEISISKFLGGRYEKPIMIRVEDKRGRCIAVEISMGLVEFAEALMGRGAIECEFEFNDSGRVGTVGQNKEERVPVPSYTEQKNGWETAALAPFEVDGWKARHSDINNHHRWSRDKDGREYQSVTFFRNVPAEDSPTEEQSA